VPDVIGSRGALGGHSLSPTVTRVTLQALARSLVRIAIASVVLFVGIALLARGGVIVSSYTLFIGVGHVHAAASGVALLIAFVVLVALFGGGKKSGGSSGK